MASAGAHVKDYVDYVLHPNVNSFTIDSRNRIISAATATVIAETLIAPTNVIKQRQIEYIAKQPLNTKLYQLPSMTQTFKNIVTENGYVGLFHGYYSILFKQIGYKSLVLFSYEPIRNQLSNWKKTYFQRPSTMDPSNIEHEIKDRMEKSNIVNKVKDRIETSNIPNRMKDVTESPKIVNEVRDKAESSNIINKMKDKMDPAYVIDKVKDKLESSNVVNKVKDKVESSNVVNKIKDKVESSNLMNEVKDKMEQRQKKYIPSSHVFDEHSKSALVCLLSGGLSGIIGYTIVHPVEALKSPKFGFPAQSPSGNIGTNERMEQMKNVGKSRYWLKPNLMYAFLIYATEFGGYDYLKSYIMNNSIFATNYNMSLTYVLSAATIGTVSTFVSVPADIIRARSMDPINKMKGSEGVLSHIMRQINEEGTYVFRKKLMLSMTRKTLWLSGFFLTYEQLRHYLNINYSNSQIMYH